MRGGGLSSTSRSTVMRIDNSYCDFVPYLYQNEIVLVKNVSKGWDLQASTVLANENLRDIEVPVDEPGKDRRTMRLAEFFELARKSAVSRSAPLTIGFKNKPSH